MSDRGTPRTWRHMHGYASSTYLWENAAGQKFWVKYHFKTEQGIQNMTDAEARAMRAADLDCHRRDLWEAIVRNDYPAWRLEMQIMPQTTRALPRRPAFAEAVGAARMSSRPRAAILVSISLGHPVPQARVADAEILLGDRCGALTGELDRALPELPGVWCGHDGHPCRRPPATSGRVSGRRGKFI